MPQRKKNTLEYPEGLQSLFSEQVLLLVYDATILLPEVFARITILDLCTDIKARSWCSSNFTCCIKLLRQAQELLVEHGISFRKTANLDLKTANDKEYTRSLDKLFQSLITQPNCQFEFVQMNLPVIRYCCAFVY